MKLAAELGSYPAARPLNADQVVEFHAARLLLLLYLCGTKKRVHGLTKLAKLDFFVRYPGFFDRAVDDLGAPSLEAASVPLPNDSAMVRHHYGPWDPRYYEVLAYLEGRELITVEKEKAAFVFALSETGATLAKRLASEASYAELAAQMKRVKKVFGDKSGDWLKKLVYRVFDDEVAKLTRGQVIR